MTMGRSRASHLLRLALGISLLAACASPCRADDFYQGKVVRIVTASGPGSTYDSYSRLLAQFLSAHVPGHPTFIVQTMSGAGGLVSAQYMYGAAPRDGTVIAGGTSSLPVAPLLSPDLTQMDVTRFAWLGNMSKDAYVAYVWSSTPFRTYEDFKSMEAIVGGLSPGSPSFNLAAISNALFGTKIKIVTGYDDQAAVQLAIERGEVQGSFGGVYNAIKIARPAWLTEHKVRFILQHGLARLPELPDTPLFIEQAKTAEDRQALELALAPQEFSKTFFAPPGTPADRVDILRRGFAETMQDAALIAAADKAGLSIIGVMTGEELTAKVSQIAATPRPAVERVVRILASASGSPSK